MPFDLSGGGAEDWPPISDYGPMWSPPPFAPTGGGIYGVPTFHGMGSGLFGPSGLNQGYEPSFGDPGVGTAQTVNLRLLPRYLRSLFLLPRIPPMPHLGGPYG